MDIAAGPVDLPYAIVDSETGQHSDRIVSDWNGDDPFIRTERYPLVRLPGDHPQPQPKRRIRDRQRACADAEALGGLSVPSELDRRRSLR